MRIKTFLKMIMIPMVRDMIPMVREERRWHKLGCENEASNIIIRTSIFKKMEEMYFFILYIKYN